jgi:mRNA interferase MazF
LVIHRGEIWWATLPEPVGSEPGFRRPLLILQTDSFNRSRIQTTVGVVLTSNLALAESPGNVFLARDDTGLPRDSVANVSQIVTADKRFLGERVSSVSGAVVRRVEEGVRLVLGLE